MSKVKRRYSYIYLLRAKGGPAGVHHWTVERRRELVEQTGVKWSVVIHPDYVEFQPVPDYRGPGLANPALEAQFIETYHKIQVSQIVFIGKIAEAMGIEYRTACEIAVKLVRDHIMTAHQNRSGAHVAVHLRKSDDSW